MGLGRLWLRELEEEDEETAELYYELHKSGQWCTICGEGIMFADEAVMVSVCALQVTASGILYTPLFNETGDFAYVTHFLCCDCYETSKEDIVEAYEDTPPVEDMYAVLECTTCGSGIREGETVVPACFGEIHCSKRSPNGKSGGPRFEAMDPDPDVYCLGCSNVGDFALWDDGLKQFNECDEGTFARCWRYGCSAQGDCGNCKEMK